MGHEEGKGEVDKPDYDDVGHDCNDRGKVTSE